MCGVTVVVGRYRKRVLEVAKQFEDVLRARGPDGMGTVVEECPSGLVVAVTASVLWIRGAAMAQQPLVSEEGVMAWNGELYNEEALNNPAVSDSVLLFAWLREMGAAAVAKCEGPFALTYVDKKRQTLLFARNRFGQRSLLVSFPASLPGERITHEPDHAIGEGSFNLAEESVVVVSSVVPAHLHRVDGFHWREVPVSGAFELDLSCCDRLTLRQVLSYEPLPKVRRLENAEIHAGKEIMRLLRASVRKRVCSLGASAGETLRLLFSGGVDCLLLAALIHEVLPPSVILTLRNVAFGTAASAETAFDRVQARVAVAELKKLFPERDWMLEEATVGEEELTNVLKRVEELTFPQTSVMDVTIGSVLWFAFGGSDCKVVFTGIGADELFAGYARHKARFSRAGNDWQVLSNELLCETERIAYRNNGRDDRICGSTGKEARHPYLDEALARFALSCPLAELADFYAPNREGGKTVLRDALRDMGFSSAEWNCPKKAMQFGSRVTKLATFRHTRRGSEEFEVAK